MSRVSALLFPLALAASALVLQGCSGDNIGPPGTGPYLLNVVGNGNGDGRVTSQPAGLDCAIGGGSSTGQCSKSFPAQTAVVLTATADDGFGFTGWNGGCQGTDPTCQLTLTAAASVTASFSAGPFILSVTGQGNGTISSNPAGIQCVVTSGQPAQTGCSATYPAGTVVTLTAAPLSGGTFSGWSDPCSGTGPCQLTMNRAATITANFGQPGNGNESTVGKWDPPFDTPVVAVHLSLVPTGKVVMFGLIGESEIWDPQHPEAGFTHRNLGAELFCAGHTITADGKLLVVGGHISDGHGTKDAKLFDPATEQWTTLPNLHYGRWYPTATVLPNGTTMVSSGADENHVFIKPIEIWDGSSFRVVDVPNGWGYYPRLFVAPNGKIFYAGEWPLARWFDPSTGKFTIIGDRSVLDRGYAGGVMYAPGKVIYAGGGSPPTNSVELIDLNVAAPTWRMGRPMAFARHQVNATILADGKVLITGGTAGPGKTNEGQAVKFAELWNPATEQWTTMSAQVHPRIYHSTAILLPDARVLTAGGGEAVGMTQQTNAEIFSPPYLFNPDGSLAVRPVITSAPTELHYGQSFTVQAQGASTVQRGNLIRLGSATHAFNMSQHIYPVTFTQSGSTLTSMAPTSPNLAPPGPYLLFLLNDKGVPSVAKIVMLKN
jgi:galactose oxidase-like protein/List-Bact-rpt repeat protein